VNKFPGILNITGGYLNEEPDAMQSHIYRFQLEDLGGEIEE
jgi:hypothetical protein